MEPIKKRIIDLLTHSKESLTIMQISEMLKISRITASKYMSVLEAEAAVERRDVGMAKLFSLKKRDERNK